MTGRLLRSGSGYSPDLAFAPLPEATRRSPEQVTVYAGVGLAFQDVVAA